ncbi:uncharacterized protein [Anabrus simplex]|uniref:uncharacterized protein n=1 Tax=Anabrus simplex TaxID=316456 RepID=UPI0035A2975F
MDSDSEEEIFFGPVTDREKQVALKFYEKFPGELRISSCLTYDIPGNIADVLPNRNLDETSARNSTVSEDLVSIMDESKESIMLETDVGNPSDVLPDRILVESSVGNSAVSEDKVYISDESKHGIILETNVENPADVSPDRILDESPAANSTVSEDVMCISEEGKHVVMLGTNGGNHSGAKVKHNHETSPYRLIGMSDGLLNKWKLTHTPYAT